MKPTSSSQGEKSIRWEQVQSGASVLRLWKGKEYPQVAILKLSGAAYNKVRKDLASFINSARIFPKDVQNPSGPGVRLITNKQNGQVLLIVQHGRPSRSPWVLIPIGDPGPDSPRWGFVPRGNPAPALR